MQNSPTHSSQVQELSCIKVFVYGTLKPGERYHNAYCADTLIAAEPAWAQGSLYHLNLGYPAMTTGTETVQGYVLTLASTALAQLDELEDYHPDDQAADNLYERRQIEVWLDVGPEDWRDRPPLSLPPSATVWVYWMSPSKIQVYAGQHVPDGCWHESHWH